MFRYFGVTGWGGSGIPVLRCDAGSDCNSVSAAVECTRDFDCAVSGLRDIGVTGYRGYRISGLQDIGVTGYQEGGSRDFGITQFSGFSSCRDCGLPGLRGIRSSGYREYRLSSYRAFGILGYHGISVSRYQDCGLPGLRGSGSSGYREYRLSGFRAFGIWGYHDISVSRYQDLRVTGIPLFRCFDETEFWCVGASSYLFQGSEKLDPCVPDFMIFSVESRKCAHVWAILREPRAPVHPLHTLSVTPKVGGFRAEELLLRSPGHLLVGKGYPFGDLSGPHPNGYPRDLGAKTSILQSFGYTLARLRVRGRASSGTDALRHVSLRVACLRPSYLLLENKISGQHGSSISCNRGIGI